MATLNLDPTPTAFEREMADYRRECAEQERASVAEIAAVCGPGAVRYAFWIVTDKLGKEPVKKIPTCRRNDSLGWQPEAPNPLERLVNSPLAWVDKAGVRHEPFRYSVGIQVFTGYTPKTAEELAVARARREGKKLEAIREDLALFPELATVNPVPGIRT